jgi:uncharacterized protein YjbI with pentapeptide repeats
MSPQVEAAIIAGCVGILTLIATVIAQIVGFRSTGANTQRQINAQREQLDTTLKAQSEQLKQTLAEQRTRTLNERFATAAGQLGSDNPAICLAGVYAMAGLADDWPENRQTCVDVLCGYLRMPYEPDPGEVAPEPEWLAFRSSREVRHTVIRVITAHLKADAAVSWQGLNFDFTGVIFDGGDFVDAKFSGGLAVFDGAEFCGGEVRFIGARFSGGKVFFGDARFSGGTVRFDGAEFSGGTVSFRRTEFSGGTVRFDGAEFCGGEVRFDRARFSGGMADFTGAEFSGGMVDFTRAKFSGGTVDFSVASFSGSTVDFGGAAFSGGTVIFGHVGDFESAAFSGGTVDFSVAGDWSFPPAFPWTDTPPSGVKVPQKEGQSRRRRA